MTTLPPPSDAHRALGDVLARIVTAKLALEDGAIDYAWAVLHELELDLGGDLERWQERPAA
jgi:hypothetical protein